MTETARLRLPLIAAAQAQKHVTHNEALMMLDTLLHLSVIDKDLVEPPAGAGEGDTYIVAAGATGAWLGWDNRIARMQDGAWRSFLPGAGGGAGWLAFVQDEAAVYVFDGAEWSSFTQGPAGIGGLRYDFGSGTDTASDPGAGHLRFDATDIAAVTEVAVSHLDANGIDQSVFVAAWDCAAGQPVRGHLQLRRPGVAGAFALFALVGDSIAEDGWSRLAVTPLTWAGTFAGGNALDAVFRGTGEKGADGQSYAVDAVAEDVSGLDDHDAEERGFSVLVIDGGAIRVKLSGDPGDWSQPLPFRGRDGLDAGLPWRFDEDSDTGSEPASGAMRVDDADPALAGTIAISAHSVLPGSPDVAVLLADWGAADNPVKGVLTATAQGAPERFARWSVLEVTPDDGFVRLFVAGGIASGSFAADETVVLRFTPAGERGEAGPSGPNVALDYRWAAGLAGDPGPGAVRGNHASVPSISALAISTLDRHGTNHYALIEAADDSTSLVRGTARLIDLADRANWAEFAITGEFQAHDGWYEASVAHVGSAGSFAPSALLALAFTRTGDSGAMAGPAESVVGQPAFFASTDGNTITGGTVLSPAELTADAHDYEPSGLASAVMLRLGGDAPLGITGLAGGGGQREITLVNAGAHPLTLAAQDAGSQTQNRFALSADIVIRPDAALRLFYDVDTLRWRAIGVAGGEGGMALPVPAGGDAGKLPVVGAGEDGYELAALDALLTDPWIFQPLGVPIPVMDNLAGAGAPPTDRNYRYIRLSASDAYNAGVLTAESVSGAAPLVQATAQVELSASPMQGQTVRLVNTERRVLRAGSAGTAEADQMQQITGAIELRASWAGTGAGALLPDNAGVSSNRQDGSAANMRLSFDSAGSPGARTGTETRAKNLGVTYYMRIL